MFDKNKVKLGIAPIAWTNDCLLYTSRDVSCDAVQDA